MSTRRSWSVPKQGQAYQAALTASEIKYGLPANLLARVAYQESRFRNDIITGETASSAGAQGIMQIVPKWHPNVNPLDPYDAIDYAGLYLKDLYTRFGSWPKALAAYNWGPTALRRAINDKGNDWISIAPTETQNYVSQITKDVPV